MNIFQLIKLVLDDIYPEIDDSATELFGQPVAGRNEAILVAMEYLRRRYATLTTNPDTVDYAAPEVRFAYIYKYVTCHANLVHAIVHRTPLLRNLFDQNIVRVTALGGGPGTELLGILKYIMEAEKACTLNCNMLDKERLWGLSWNDVGPKVASSALIHTTVQPVNVLESSSWKPYYRLFGSTNLFTLVFFMSELHHYSTEAAPFFQAVIENAPPGSMFLYIDNSDARFYSQFDGIAQNYEMETITSGQIHRWPLPSSEELSDLGSYVRVFGWPRMKASIAYRVARKK